VTKSLQRNAAQLLIWKTGGSSLLSHLEKLFCLSHVGFLCPNTSKCANW